jgi:tripartite-type tricarboxylate transporter receptor subunit TctC
MLTTEKMSAPAASWVPNRRRWVAAAVAGVLSAAAPFAAMAQSAAAWPGQPVKLVVGFPAGSSPDLMARTLSEPLSAALGQPVVVENRPGAGGNIAAAYVARATDDHTLGLMINGNMTTAKILNPATPYDPLTDLTPVALISVAPLVLAAPVNSPEGGSAFLAAALASGDKWNYGSPGVGTVAHLGMELIKSLTGMAPVHVPYKGNPAVIAGMLGGQIQMALLPPGLAMVQVNSGKLRAVGVTSAGRSSVVPAVPTLSEAGVKGLELEIWNAGAAPNSLPKAHVTRLSQLLVEIVRRPEIREQMVAQGWQVAGSSPEGLANRIRKDTATMSKVIERTGAATK